MVSVVRLLSSLFIMTQFSHSAAADQAVPCTPVPSLEACATIEFASTPKANQDSPFVLSFTKLNASSTREGGTILPSKPFKVNLWMPDMGHGSSPVKIARFPLSAVYYVDHVFFVMDGNWEIKINETAIPVQVQ